MYDGGPGRSSGEPVRVRICPLRIARGLGRRRRMGRRKPPMPTLFDPLEVGELRLPNRIIMAPLTRCRAGAGRVPNALMSEYYAQRASAGLIISEATSVSPMGVGYPGHARHLVAGAGRGLEARHPGGPQRGRPDPAPALARGADVGPAITWMAPCRSRRAPSPPAAIRACCGRRGRSSRPGRWRRARSRASSRNIAAAPRTPGSPASTASRSTGPTATCSTSSSRTARIIGPTSTAARSRTGPG